MVPVAKNTIIIPSGTIHNLKQHELIKTAVEMITELYSFLLQETMDQASVSLL
jgi:hypothetical protein